jgi:MFS family permease
MKDEFEGYDLDDAHNGPDDSSDDDSDDSDEGSDEDSDDDGSDDDSDADSDDGSDDDSDSEEDSDDADSDDDDSADEEKVKKDKNGKKDKKGKKGKKNEKSFGDAFRDLFIQPDVPKELKLYRRENLGIPLTYFVLGLTQGFLLPILHDLPKDLGATSAEQGSILAIYNLPFYFQIFLAFFSDTKTIKGDRRKPYMTMGWVFAIIAIIALFFLSDASHTPGTTPSADAPSVGFLTTILFFYGFGSTLASVATDGMIVEKYLLEAEDRKGHFLVSCLAFKYFGYFFSVPTGTAIYEGSGSGMILFLLGIFPFLLFPFYCFLREQDLKKKKIQPAKKQAVTIWESIKTKAVYHSLGALCFYLSLQIQNTALGILLLDGGLSDSNVNLTVTLAIFCLFVGILVYKRYLMIRNWKEIFMATTAATAVLTLFQFMLANGSANLFLAIIYRMLSGLIDAFELVPVMLILVAISIKGSEATTFAMYSTIATFAMEIAKSISVSLQARFNITEETLADDSAGSTSGLVIVVAILPVLGLLGIRYMPTDKGVIESWKKTKKLTMGLILVGVIALSIFYALVVSLLSFVVYEVAVSD